MGRAFGKNDYTTPRTCQLNYVDLFTFKVTSSVTDIKAKCLNEHTCILSESKGFNETFDYNCGGEDFVRENPILPTKPAEKSGYMCSCGSEKIPKLNKTTTKGNNICRDSCHDELKYVYSCGVVRLEYAGFGNIDLEGTEASVVSDECITMRCGPQAYTFGGVAQPNEICTDEKGTESYVCNGEIMHNYLNTSQGYLCNCEKAPLISGSWLSDVAKGAGDYDSCKGKYGLQSGPEPSGSSGSGSSFASETTAAGETSSPTGKSRAVKTTANGTLKSIVGWATFSLFMVGLMA